MRADAASPSGGVPRPVLTSALETDDLDELGAAFGRWDQRFEQLGAGRFQGRLRFADLGGVQLLCVETNRVVRTRGSRPADSFVFSPVTTEIAGSYWRGRTLAPGMVNVLAPQAEMDHRTCPDYRTDALVVRRDLLEQFAATLIGVGLDRLLCGNRALDIGVEHAVKLAGMFREATLRLVPRPDGERSPPPDPVEPSELVTVLLGTLATGRVVDPYRTTAGQRIAVVRKVEEYVRAFSEDRIGVLQLCALAGVSKRTLHYAFLEVTGGTPKDFVKLIKLNAARRDLLAIGPGPGHVEQVARRYGFNRPGNFAADFRRLFGELPSRYIRQRGR
jgi:AraC family ethanolamine operon transcriptional activator